MFVKDIQFFKMIPCEKCGNFFRDLYDLKRHMSRKKPCVAENVEKVDDTLKKIEKNNPSGRKNNPFSEKITPQGEKITPRVEKITPRNKKKCQMFLNTFSSEKYKNDHEKICKHRNETRELEIEMEIEPDMPACKTECRFCNKNLSRTDKLFKHILKCNERFDYHNRLLKQQEKNKKESQPMCQTINNGTINNGTINNGTINNTNNTINIFGSQRSLEHIQVERIIQFLRDLKRKNLTDDQTYEQAGDLIIMMENYIQEDTNNKNFVIPNFKSQIGYIKKENDWEITGVDKPLNIQFKETAGILCEKQNDIETVNEKVFQNNNNVEIFKHVKQFNNKGFSHNMYGDQKLKVIKTNFKITKLKNKNVTSV